MIDRLQKLIASRAALPLIVLLFLGAIAWQWPGAQSIAVADEIGYVTSGVNLVTTGCFINPWGEPELWFPPVYPVLIGLGSLGGRWDPFVTARVLSVIAAVISLLTLHRVALRLEVGRIPQNRSLSGEPDASPRHSSKLLTALGADRSPRVFATMSVALLAANPTFQIFANRALSESLALCFTLLALHVWLSSRSRCGALATGVFIGLATLTRPECILLAPLWYGLDWLRQRDRTTFRRGLVCGAMLAALLLPYIAFLHEHTGRWTISNKGEVNLAAGRAAFHQTPREYIDETTLELGYFPVDTSLPTELQRYVFNLRKLVAAFCEIYCRPLLAAGVMVLIITGAVLLWRQKEQRLVLGLAAGLVYLIAVVRYDVAGAKNLHLALPTFSLLMAMTLTRTLQVARWRRVLPVCGLTALIMLEGATRFPRWSQTSSTVEFASLRDAGQQLRASHFPRGVMYEYGASTAYYSGQWRRYLTPNSLDTILDHIAAYERTAGPVYLTVSAATSRVLHPTTRALLTESDPRLERVLEIDSPDRVVIYRVKRES